MSSASPKNFCEKCGATLSPGASFCPNCGTPVSTVAGAGSGVPPSAQPQDWRELRRQYKAQRRAERYEKYEKNEKLEKGEKGRGRAAIVGPITGGLISIWLGATFYLQQENLLPSDNWWAYFLAGIGAIIILQGILQYALTQRGFYGSFIGGAILLILGIAFIYNYNFSFFWPLVLVVIGIAVLASAFTARRNRPIPP